MTAPSTLPTAREIEEAKGRLHDYASWLDDDRPFSPYDSEGYAQKQTDLFLILSRLSSVEGELTEALGNAQDCRERALERTVRAQSAESLLSLALGALEKISDYGDKFSGAEAQHLGRIARRVIVQIKGGQAKVEP